MHTGHLVVLWVCLVLFASNSAHGATQVVVADVLVSGARVSPGNLTNATLSTVVNASSVMDIASLLVALRNAGVPSPTVSMDSKGGLSVAWTGTSVTATPCAAGYFSPSGVGVCSMCPLGTYSDGVQLGGCTFCPAGTYGTTRGGVGLSAACTPCPVATYSPIVGAMGVSACTACPSGYSSPMGSDSDSSCTLNVNAAYDQTLSTATVIGAVAGGGVAVVMLGVAVGRPVYNLVAGGGVKSKLGKLEPSPLLAVKIDAWPLRWLNVPMYTTDYGERVKFT